MRWEIVCLLLAAIYSVYATSPAVDPNSGEPQRFLWVGTTTVTSTVSTSTTCTTSTAALTTCTIGRRRRGLFYDEAQQSSGRNRRGLFYGDEEVDSSNGQLTAFLPSEKKASSSDPVAEVIQVAPKSSATVPLVIESGFSAPEGGPDRFLLQLAVSTVTSYTTTTTTTSLTAFCSSTTGWPLCGNFGK